MDRRQLLFGMTALALSRNFPPHFLLSPQDPEPTGQPKNLSDRERDGLRGPVKTCVGGTTTTEYDPDGRMLSTHAVEPDGREWGSTQTYDSSGRLLRISSRNWDGSSTAQIYSYDDEFVAPHLPAYEFAGEVVRRLVAPTTQGQRRKILAVYLDPSNFKNIGDGHTIANQINEVLEPYDLGVIPASNDRIGGWQLMYQTLQTGEWQIADTCPKLIEAIPSRMHDEKRPGDVLKVPGDPLDDVADDVRYGLYTFINASEKPRELRIREALKPLAEIQDMTSAYVRWKQVTAEPQYRPATFGRYSRRRW